MFRFFFLQAYHQAQSKARSNPRAASSDRCNMEAALLPFASR